MNVRTAAMTALIVVWSSLSAAEELIIDGKAIQPEIKHSSKSDVKRFDKAEREMLEANIVHRYLSAFAKDRGHDTAPSEGSETHRQAAVAYAGASAYKYAAGMGLDASGLAHLGLNVLLSTSEYHRREQYQRELRMIEYGTYQLVKIFDVQSVEEAASKAIEELRTGGFSKLCGVDGISDKGIRYVKNRYLGASVLCESIGSTRLLQVRAVVNSPNLKGVASGGYEAWIAFADTAVPPHENHDEWKRGLDILRTEMAPGWFVVAADIVESKPAKSILVWKDGAERRYPLPRQ
jgi:hypothetical protein